VLKLRRTGYDFAREEISFALRRALEMDFEYWKISQNICGSTSTEARKNGLHSQKTVVN
jgi:hypothetical protein